MKKLLTIFCLFISGSLFAQKVPDFGFSKIRIMGPYKSVVAEIIPVNHNPKPKQDLFYSWYSANLIHTTQGGFSGQLLNGQYTEYYLNKNLETQGVFKKGLKDGVWKTWNEDGTLNQLTVWKNGVIVSGDKPSFWKKINVFKRKKRPIAADSLAKPK